MASKIIANKKELIEAVEYVAIETSKMARKITGESFPIMSLTIFSHSEPEFESLGKILAELGEPYNYNNGPRIKLHKPIEIDGNKILYLRIRKPDIERPQVGCDDFETDFKSFKEKYLSKHANLELIRRPEYDMIEMKDKEFEVLAYVVDGGDYGK